MTIPKSVALYSRDRNLSLEDPYLELRSYWTSSQVWACKLTPLVLTGVTRAGTWPFGLA